MNFFFLLSATAFLAGAFAIPTRAPCTNFIPASKIYPAVSTLGPTIEGASVDAAGNLYAVNRTSLIELHTGRVVYSSNLDAKQQHFSSSRFARSGVALLGDAVGHRVNVIDKEGGKVLGAFEDRRLLQPNDIALSKDGKDVYLSGMDYAKNGGELWYSLDGGDLVKVDVGKEGLFRTNGIEVSADGKTLLLTSAENGEAGAIASAKIYAFELQNGVPQTPPKVAFDLGATFPQLLKLGMDPDGMRSDSAGNIYNTLNAVGRVLRWNINNPTRDWNLYDLPSVGFPTNLEMGGKDGKTLMVVGRCRMKDGKIDAAVEESCADVARVASAGRAWNDMQERKYD
jgi:gluconolactonase